MRFVPQVVAVLSLASASAFAADGTTPNLNLPASSGTPAGTTELPGVTVQRKMDPLSRSDRQLARTKKSLPGTDTAAAPDLGDKAKSYAAAHADPNAATGQQRKMMQGAQEAPPEAIPGAGFGAHP